MGAWIAVAIGGAMGSVARFWLTSAMTALTGPRFPWGTLLINVLGSFVIGLVAGITLTSQPGRHASRYPHLPDDRGLWRVHHVLSVQPANAGIDASGRDGPCPGLRHRFGGVLRRRHFLRLGAWSPVILVVSAPLGDQLIALCQPFGTRGHHGSCHPKCTRVRWIPGRYRLLEPTRSLRSKRSLSTDAPVLRCRRPPGLRGIGRDPHPPRQDPHHRPLSARGRAQRQRRPPRRRRQGHVHRGRRLSARQHYAGELHQARHHADADPRGTRRRRGDAQFRRAGAVAARLCLGDRHRTMRLPAGRA